jgi:hypothetical protein
METQVTTTRPAQLVNVSEAAQFASTWPISNGSSRKTGFERDCRPNSSFTRRACLLE